MPLQTWLTMRACLLVCGVCPFRCICEKTPVVLLTKCVCAHGTEYYEAVWLHWMCAPALAAMNSEISFCPPSASHTSSHTFIHREYCIWKQRSLLLARGLVLAYFSLFFWVHVGNFTHSQTDCLKCKKKRIISPSVSSFWEFAGLLMVYGLVIINVSLYSLTDTT